MQLYHHAGRGMAAPTKRGSPVAIRVPYTERQCRHPQCKAGLRLLNPLPSQVLTLQQLGISPFAVFETNAAHLPDHADVFEGPEACRTKTVQEIRKQEERAIAELEDEDAKEMWRRKRALSLPKTLSTTIRHQVAEPLRRSDKTRDSMERLARDAAQKGSASSAAEASILESQPTKVWKNRVSYQRATAVPERMRLTKDVYNTWLPHQVRPTNFELHRPWLFFFQFSEEDGQTNNGYAWTTLSMLRAAH